LPATTPKSTTSRIAAAIPTNRARPEENKRMILILLPSFISVSFTMLTTKPTFDSSSCCYTAVAIHHYSIGRIYHILSVYPIYLLYLPTFGRSRFPPLAVFIIIDNPLQHSTSPIYFHLKNTTVCFSHGDELVSRDHIVTMGGITTIEYFPQVAMTPSPSLALM